MCSGSEEGSYLRLIDFAYHSTLSLRVIMKKNLGDVQNGGDGHGHEKVPLGVRKRVSEPHLFTERRWSHSSCIEPMAPMHATVTHILDVTGGCGPSTPFRQLAVHNRIVQARSLIPTDETGRGQVRLASEKASPNRTCWFRAGLVFKAHRLLYHSTLGLKRTCYTYLSSGCRA